MRPTATHPDLDRWLAYRAGDLVEEEQGTLQDHLVECRDCTRLVLDLEAFAGPPPADTKPGVSEIEKAAVWRMLRPRLAEDQRPPEPVRRRWRMPATLAASVLLAASGLGIWLKQQELTGLRHQLAELSRPQANVAIYDLVPGDAVRGEAAFGVPEINTLELAAGTRDYTLILNRASAGEHSGYRAEILTGDGATVATIEGLASDEMGVFTLRLPRSTLTAGDYVLRLYGLEDGGEVALEDYPLRLIQR